MTNHFLLIPIFHIIPSVIKHGKEHVIVTKDDVFADKVQEMAVEFMRTKAVATSHDDVGAPHHIDSLDISALFSWTCVLNHGNVSNYKDMKSMKNMTQNQILWAGVRADGSLCQAYLFGRNIFDVIIPIINKH